ncbi:MAG: DUF58 domain-containing protein [Hyphomicrobiaceae bacterium]
MSAGISDSPSGGSVFGLENEAHGLAERLPDLVLEAMRVANTVAHGIHGRRRAGPGETFWQFRHFQFSDTAQMIDWRRSASSDQLFVREREWEAAHTVWLWSDRSPSMRFQSELSQTSKHDRGLVLMLALSELLVRGGERIGVLGLTQPTASRRASTRVAEALATSAGLPSQAASLPPPVRLGRFTSAVIISDFLDPPEEIGQRLGVLAANGVEGHLVQVLDPAEETLPYEGRAEFLGLEGDDRMLANRVEALRERYVEKLALHRAAVEQVARRMGWSFLVHHTDRPAGEALLSLFTRMTSAAGDYRWSQPQSSGPARPGGRA